MATVPAPIAPPKIERLSIKNWLKGVITAFDDARTPNDGLRGSGNVILDQNGTIRPRPPLVSYGTAFPGTLLGELFEFTKQTTGLSNDNYLLGMFNVAGTVKVYYSKDGGAWSAANGKTYDTTAKAHYCQIDLKVLVMNGTDNLSYMDIPTLAVVPFTTLSTPTAPTLTTNNVTGVTFNIYYKITANSSVGETAASTALTVQISTLRDIWTPATQNITIGWSAVASAVSYNVYMGDVLGQEYLIAAGVNGLSYKDDGSNARDINHPAPLGDTTAGPKTTRGTVINGQVFLVGDKDNPRYVRFGGTGVSVLDFSPFNGGGWTELGRGAKEIPVHVKSFRDGRGNSQVTVLCKGTNGTGKRYLLTPQSTTVGTTVINYFAVTEDNGQDGTDSPDGIILYRDSIYYPSRDGFKTTGTKPQLQNILSTETISETIINDVRVLNNANMDGAVGMAFQDRLYWALPNGSTTNNEIWVLDLQRQGAWMKPWNVPASWMMLYNDNAGNTHHVVVSANAMYEFSYNGQATSDAGVAFPTNARSGLVKFSEDGLEWAKVIDVTFILLRPQGAINFTVSGQTEESTALQTVGTGSFVPSSSVAGWSEAGWGGNPDATSPRRPTIFGWSNFTVVPVAFADVSRQVTVEVDEELQWLTWEMNSVNSGVDYQLADVIARVVKIGVKDLT